MYAKIVNGVVQTYPYTLKQLRADNPDVTPPTNPTPEQLANEWGVHVVFMTAQPAFDPLTHRVVQLTPAYSVASSRWEVQWQVEPLSAGELADITERQADEAALAVAKADNVIRQLVTSTPAQINNYIDGLGINDPAARALFKKLAVALSVIGRRTLR